MPEPDSVRARVTSPRVALDQGTVWAPIVWTLSRGLEFLHMAETIITLSQYQAAQGKGMRDTRIETLGADITYDVSNSCWLYFALSLDHFAEADGTDGWVAVPAHVFRFAVRIAYWGALSWPMAMTLCSGMQSTQCLRTRC